MEVLQPARMRLVLRGGAAGVAIGLFLCLVLAAHEYGDLFITRFSALIFAGFFWFCVAVFVLALVLVLFKRFRSAAIQLLAAEFSMVAVVAIAATPTVAFAHRMALENMLRQAEPVAAALEAFQAEHGRPANDVGQLGGRFLPEAPKLAYDDCYYRYAVFANGTDPNSDKDAINPEGPSGDQLSWEFSVDCHAGWLFDLETLTYRPDGDYETVQAPHMRKPMGDWMYYYFHD